MTKSLNIKFENGVRFLVKHLPQSDDSSRKPILFHNIRVGMYLYNNEYSENVVLAGLLHDVIEWSDAAKEMVRDEFGENVLKLVLANTKNEDEKINDLIQRCTESGQNSLIVKTADIIDSFQWYASQNNTEQLKYCMKNANAIFKYKKDDFNDKIFDELKTWKEKFNHLNE